MHINPRELLTLTTLPGIGSQRLINLIAHFRDTRAILAATPKELIKAQGIEKKTALNIVNHIRDSGLDQAGRLVSEQMARLDAHKARIVTYWDKDFPQHLKNIYDPPAFLFVKGSLQPEDSCAIALVGTRTMSPYGQQMAESFASGLARAGITVVSGLARGIDTAAHAATVKAGGRTIAIVGSGVDVIYPPENKGLAGRIEQTGAILSEFLMGAKPDASNFPRRNRIISGMTLGTVVIETGIEGGAMITASLAFDQNREVFAVPSPVNSKRVSGTNLLIKQRKASLVESVEDVIEILAPQLKGIISAAAPQHTPPQVQLSVFEQKLFDTLGTGQMHIDALAEQAGFSTADALVHLLSLEFKGLVKQNPGKMFLRTS